MRDHNQLFIILSLKAINNNQKHLQWQLSHCLAVRRHRCSHNWIGVQKIVSECMQYISINSSSLGGGGNGTNNPSYTHNTLYINHNSHCEEIKLHCQNRPKSLFLLHACKHTHHENTSSKNVLLVETIPNMSYKIIPSSKGALSVTNDALETWHQCHSNNEHVGRLLSQLCYTLHQREFKNNIHLLHIYFSKLAVRNLSLCKLPLIYGRFFVCIFFLCLLKLLGDLKYRSQSPQW